MTLRYISTHLFSNLNYFRCPKKRSQCAYHILKKNTHTHKKTCLNIVLLSKWTNEQNENTLSGTAFVMDLMVVCINRWSIEVSGSRCLTRCDRDGLDDEQSAHKIYCNNEVVAHTLTPSVLKQTKKSMRSSKRRRLASHDRPNRAS